METQKEFPSMAEELFTLAIFRLPMANQLMKEAKDHYRGVYGKNEPFDDANSTRYDVQKSVSSTVREEVKMIRGKKSISLKQIDEALNSSSNDERSEGDSCKPTGPIKS